MSTQTSGTHHRFFLYLPPHLVPRSLGVSSSFQTIDKQLAPRIYQILRLQPGETITFFTGVEVIDVCLTQSPQPKTTITGTVTGFYEVPPRPRTMVAALSLLKKDAFEAAVYSAAQMGCEIITPVITAKSRQKYMNDREPERLQSIIIAACEQSKNPHIPKLAAPVTLEQILNRYKKSTLVCFDADGCSLPELATALTQTNNNVCTLIGPEGGLVPDELATIAAAGAVTARLTKTILRSRDAACLGLGVVSSVVL